MALRIVEFFGYSPKDASDAAGLARQSLACPFVDGICTKRLRGDRGVKLIGGACTVRQATPNPVICCPKRLYAGGYQILQHVADVVFGPGLPFIPGNQASTDPRDGDRVLAFGSSLGGEVKLPSVGGRGGFFVDWILARVDRQNELREFVAVEVQSIDTTGNYRQERDAYLAGSEFAGYSKAGINWENVNKRILPQLIYKGHVLRRETLCKAGLFFVCPTPVYEKINVRVGGNLMQYPAPAPGTLTFRWYDIGSEVHDGRNRGLVFGGQLTTTVEQLAYAFLSPGNLPPENSYASTIKAKIKALGN